MKKSPSYNVITLCVTCTLWVGLADASLVGDTVTVDHLFPDGATSLNGDGWPASVVVEAGTGDTATLYYGYPFAYNVNVEANSILVDYSYLTGVSGTWPDNCFQFSCEIGAVVTFNGLGVSNLNDSSGNPLQGVLVNTNMAGWDSSMLTFGADYVLFDWKGLSFDDTTYFNATLEFSPVPLPSAALLFGSGLIGLFGMAKRKTCV